MKKQKQNNNTWDLFYELVRTDFIIRYHNSVLGFVWVLLKPLLIFLTLMVVFSWFFKNQDPFYPLNLLLGIITYSYFQEATLRGVTCLDEKASIILKVNFPKILAIFTSVFNSFVSFFFSFIVFLIFWAYFQPAGSLIYLPQFFLLILILTGLIVSLNFFLSIIFIKFQDLQSIWEVLLRLLFYLTPVIYPLSMIPGRFQSLFLLNPLAVIVSQSRTILVTGGSLSWQQTSYILAVTLLFFITGFQFFRKYIKSIAENL